MPVIIRIIPNYGQKSGKVGGKIVVGNWSFPGRLRIIITKGFTTVFHLSLGQGQNEFTMRRRQSLWIAWVVLEGSDLYLEPWNFEHFP